jgi:hypothetical protein
VTRSHVTKREAQAVADFASEVLTALRMPSWQVLVMEEPADEDCVASISTVEGKYTAQLYLASDWMKRTDQDRRETVVHEMLHLLHFRVNHVIEDAELLLREHEAADLDRRYHRETELMVDHLAKFLSRTHTLEQAWDAAHGIS